MEIYQEKEIKYGFVILCPDHSISMVKTTVFSIQSKYENASCICVVDNQATKEDVALIKEICPVYKGGSTVTSLINVGMRHSPTEWAFLVFAGTTVRSKMNQKYSFFMNSEKDVVYPVANNKNNFIDATLNGLLINKKFFKEVGEFEEEGSLEEIKCEWACRAMAHECKFKSIVGAKLC